MRRRIPAFVFVVQSIILLAHWVVYETWMWLWMPSDPGRVRALRIVLALLSVSFIGASLLAFRSYNFFVRVFYTVSAVWMGFLDFFFLASVLCWIIYPFFALFGVRSGRILAESVFGLAALIATYGVVNAARTRVKRVSVKLPGLPDSWRGRVAALLSDTHLGHIRGRRFLSRTVATLQSLQPDVVFFPGDMFDGTEVDPAQMAAPWKKLATPFGAYFVTGNHEEFSDPAKYTQAISDAGVRVLCNEKVVVDGLQIVGVTYGGSIREDSFRAILEAAVLDRTRASILLLHVPHRLEISEEHGITLQVSGHTHGGQVPPFTWFTYRIFGKFVHGLNRFGAMSVYTSYGAGTWGPPLRFLTWPEIVLIRFE